MKCDLCHEVAATVHLDHLDLMRGGESPFRADLCSPCATQFGFKDDEMHFSEMRDGFPAFAEPETLKKDSIEWDRLIVAVRCARDQRGEPEPNFGASDALDTSVRVNGKIRAREVRVIGERNEDLGVMLLPRALEMARVCGADLIEIGPDEVPPLCRLISLVLYRHELRKRARGDAA